MLSQKRCKKEHLGRSISRSMIEGIAPPNCISNTPLSVITSKASFNSHFKDKHCVSVCVSLSERVCLSVHVCF